MFEYAMSPIILYCSFSENYLSSKALHQPEIQEYRYKRYISNSQSEEIEKDNHRTENISLIMIVDESYFSSIEI